MADQHVLDGQAKIAVGHIEPLRRGKPRVELVANGVALVDVRCRTCSKLLFRGALRGEIKCPRCRHMNRWG